MKQIFLGILISATLFSCTKQNDFDNDDITIEQNGNYSKETIVFDWKRADEVSGSGESCLTVCVEPGADCIVRLPPPSRVLLETKFNSLDLTKDNTTTLKTFLSSQTFMTTSAKQNINAATTLRLIACSTGVDKDYVVKNQTGKIVFVLKHD